MLIFSVVIAVYLNQTMEGGFEGQDNNGCQKALNKYSQENNSLGNLFNNAQIQECQSQIVAGTNFKMTLRLSSGEQCSITLYQDLQGNVSVNDNHEDTCTQMAVSS